MKQIDVMGHNKCNRNCPSTSLFSVLEVEETYGHLISPEPKYSYYVLRTGHTIPQLNSTMDTLEYIWKKWRLKQASPWWTICWPAWLNGQGTNQVLKTQLCDGHFVELHDLNDQGTLKCWKTQVHDGHLLTYGIHCPVVPMKRWNAHAHDGHFVDLHGINCPDIRISHI